MSVLTLVLDQDRSRWTAAGNAAVKVALIGAFLVAIVVAPATVEGKAMGFRAPLSLEDLWWFRSLRWDDERQRSGLAGWREWARRQ